MAACVGVAGIATAADERPPRNSAPAAPNEREFDRERRQAALSLTAQLGDPRFEIREQATKMLEQAGIEAVEPLAAAAAGDNLEVTCRAF
ncbi:MAG TPA: hypothetical protein VKU82_11445, partial [Planctomycetaceae bacterium]|nr:hypothetical protein [Planctomycetaceae bacterium]